MKKLVLLGTLMAILLFNLSGQAKDMSLAEMNETEINLFLKEIKTLPFIQRLEKVSEKAIGTTYFLGPLGEGENSPHDKNPLIDLKRVDCVTFCEQSIALAMSNDYPTLIKNLQKIRYKNGDIRIEKRNHYFMADWAINNSWLIRDITSEIGGKMARPLTRTISHEKFFANSIYKGIISEEPDRNLTISYIPKSSLINVEKSLQSGDIGVFIQDMEGIFASHTGLMIRKSNGELVFRNATSRPPKKVVDMPYPELVNYLKSAPKNMGMAFLRIKP